MTNQGVFTILSQGQGDSLAEAFSAQHDIANSEISRLLAWPVLISKILQHLLLVNRAGCRSDHGRRRGLDDLGRDQCLRLFCEEIPGG